MDTSDGVPNLQRMLYQCDSSAIYLRIEWNIWEWISWVKYALYSGRIHSNLYLFENARTATGSFKCFMKYSKSFNATERFSTKSSRIETVSKVENDTKRDRFHGKYWILQKNNTLSISKSAWNASQKIIDLHSKRKYETVSGCFKSSPLYGVNEMWTIP